MQVERYPPNTQDKKLLRSYRGLKLELTSFSLSEDRLRKARTHIAAQSCNPLTSPSCQPSDRYTQFEWPPLSSFGTISLQNVGAIFLQQAWKSRRTAQGFPSCINGKTNSPKDWAIGHVAMDRWYMRPIANRTIHSDKRTRREKKKHS